MVGPPLTVAVLVPPAVPLSVTPAPVKPLTGLLKTAVKLIGKLLVGSAWPAAWLIVTVGGLALETVTVTGAEAVRRPAASRATAVKVCGPLLALVVFHEVEYGGAVTSGPAFTPSTRNWTPATPTSSEAVAVTLVVPPTFAPGSGDVMLTVGAAGEETPRNRLSRFAVMRWMRGSTVPARSSPQLQLVVPAPNTQAPLGAW